MPPTINEATGARPNRRQRRRLIRQLKRIMDDDGDHCGICRAAFTHNCRSYGGVSADGRTVMVGDCCQPRLQYELARGLYCNSSDYDELAELAAKRPDAASSRPPRTLAEIDAAVADWRSALAKLDDWNAEVAKQAGVRSTYAIFRDSVQKSDDAAWFKANPQRSHRLRPPFEGEWISLQPDPDAAVPAGYVARVLVRQVRPGVRVRCGWHHKLEAPDLDHEPVLHALFDLLHDDRRDQGSPISGHELLASAAKYLEAAERDTDAA